MQKARLIGHCIGDGAVYKTNHDYVIKYEVKDFFSIKQFYYDLLNVHGLEPHLVHNPSGKTGNLLISVRLRSKLVFEDLHRYVVSYYSDRWYLKKEMLTAPTSDKKRISQSTL